MAKTLSSISRDSPGAALAAAPGDTFAFAGTPGFSGTSAVTRYDFKWEVNPGSGYVTIGAATALTTAATNPVTNTNQTAQFSATITCVKLGVYTIRMAGAPASGGSYTVTSATATITVALPMSVTTTGGGVAGISATKAAAIVSGATGGGVLTASAAKQGLTSPAATGGGVLALDYSVALGGAPNADASPTMTGGGVLATDISSARLIDLTATGGGILAETYTQGRILEIALTGGGAASVDATSDRWPVFAGRGGGALVMAWLGEHYAALAATGGGRATVVGMQVGETTPLPAIIAATISGRTYGGVITPTGLGATIDRHRGDTGEIAP